MTESSTEYGLWSLVIINSVIFIFFAFSFFKPRSKRDWRSFGAFSAFLVALFTEMYGFPLTIYFLSGWLQANYPEVDWLSHDAGHLLEMLFGWRVNPHLGPFHVLSMVFIGGASCCSRPPGARCMRRSVAMPWQPQVHMPGYATRNMWPSS